MHAPARTAAGSAGGGFRERPNSASPRRIRDATAESPRAYVPPIFDGRAVTICLWPEIALVLAVPLIDQFWKVPAFEKWLPLESQWFMSGIGRLPVWVAVSFFGWVADVAAGRKPGLLP